MIVNDVFQEIGNTIIEHEDVFEFAPHRYKIKNKKEPTQPTLAEIRFQEGPIDIMNGVQNIDLLAIVKNTLEYYQKTKFACRENDLAITHIETAMAFLTKRTLERKKRQVEGKMVP